MASAFTVLCDRLGPGHEMEIARAMRQRAPHAQPNRLLIQHADDALGRGGKMLDAVSAFQNGEPAIGTADQAATPKVCAFQAIVPKTTDWREFNAKFIWQDGEEHPELEPSYSVKV